MEIELSKAILPYVSKASHELGISREDVIARAILLYLKNKRGFKELQEEIRSWSKAADEDASDFFEKHTL